MQQHPLFQKIFKRNLNAEGAEELISQVKKEYPFFTAANYFLLKKTAPDTPAYENIASTTALHFASPFHLNQLLSSTEDTLYAVPGNFKVPDDENVTEEDPAPIVEQEASVIEAPVAAVAENNIPVHEQRAENGTEDNLPGTNTEALENVEQPVSHTEEVSPALPVPEENTTVTENNHEPAAKVENAKEELLFEPLYTTDYFASQGIKLSEAVQPADKLGKQLKSFTDWLKTMKKTHENRLPEGNEQMDKTVQAQAEKSNKEDDIITEAMAEAYQQQGKTLKAIEIYSKLSLLNPAKSAFFAAKIDQLK